MCTQVIIFCNSVIFVLLALTFQRATLRFGISFYRYLDLNYKIFFIIRCLDHTFFVIYFVNILMCISFFFHRLRYFVRVSYTIQYVETYIALLCRARARLDGLVSEQCWDRTILSMKFRHSKEMHCLLRQARGETCHIE